MSEYDNWIYLNMIIGFVRLQGSRSLYLTLFDIEHPDSFLACAQVQAQGWQDKVVLNRTLLI